MDSQLRDNCHRLCLFLEKNKISLWMNKCTSPHLQNILPTERKICLNSHYFSGILGRGLLSAKLRSLAGTGKEERGVWFNIFASSSCNGCAFGCGHEQHPLLCANTNPHSLQIAAFGWLAGVVQSRTAVGGSWLCCHPALPPESRTTRSSPEVWAPSQHASFC